MRIITIAAILLMLCTACQDDSVTTKHQTKYSDKVLVGRILEAQQQGISIGEIEKFVQMPATLNTIRDSDQRLMQRASYELVKEERSDISDIQEMYDQVNEQRVVYWMRPVESQIPKMVGILWTKDNIPKIFFGVVYPP